MTEYKSPHEREEWQDLLHRIKEHEGFRNTIYLDTLGKATIGYGHLVVDDDAYIEGQVYSEELLYKQFGLDFDKAFLQAQELWEDYHLPHTAQEIIIEMVFQLGMGGVSKFRKMWEALKDRDFEEAAAQMLDSRWAKQTPRRCQEMASRMASCSE